MIIILFTNDIRSTQVTVSDVTFVTLQTAGGFQSCCLGLSHNRLSRKRFNRIMLIGCDPIKKRFPILRDASNLSESKIYFK